MRDTPDIFGDQLGAGPQHAVRPAGNVRGHQHIRQLMEGACRGGCWTRLTGIAIPDIEHCAGYRTLRERLVERILVDDFRPRNVDEKGRRLYQTEPPTIDTPDRGGR